MPNEELTITFLKELCCSPSFVCQIVPSKSLFRLISVCEVAARMPDTESKKNFLMFREALTELERLVDVRGSILYNRYGTTAFSEGIVHTLKLLIEFNIGTSESNAIDELERLVQIKEKIVNQCNRTSYDTISWDHVRRFDKIIESKIDFIKNRPISIGGIEPMTALERLAAVGDKYSSRELHDLLASKVREIVYRPRAKASSRHDLIGRKWSP